MGSPIELIKYHEKDGTFHVGTNATQILKQFTGPLGVVAVCGRARSGKSYILNMLLKALGGQQSKGFQVSPTTRPCTKGLWMWSTPMPVKVDGQQYHMLLLDTEGIEAYDQTNQYSTQIFCLAVLLSSLFVFNHTGTINEGELDKLALITQMTKHIRTRSDQKGDGTSAEDLGQFTPAFLWLLRDFYLTFEGDIKTPLDYLDNDVLLERQGEAYQGKNQVRRAIKQLFPQRDICTLVRPVGDEKKINTLQDLPESELRPEFLQGLQELKAKVFAWSKPQKYKGMHVTGPILAALVETYVAAMNNGAVPNIGTAWQGVQEMECRRALDEAERIYKEEFKSEDLSPEDAVFQKEHERVFKIATAVFDKIAIGNDDNVEIKEAHRARLVESCRKHYEATKRVRTLEAENRMNEMLYTAQKKMQNVLGSDDASLDKLESELKQFLEQYESSATGPSKWQKLAEFLRDTFLRATKDLMLAGERRLKQELKETEQKLQAAQQKLGVAEQHVAQLTQKLNQSSAVASEVGSLKSELAQKAAEYEVNAKSYEIKIKRMEVELRDAMAISKKAVKSAEDAALAQQKLAERVVVETRGTLENKAAEAEQLKKHLDASNQRYKALQEALEARRSDLDQMERTYTEAATKVTSLEQTKIDLQERVTRLEADLAAVQAERDQAVARLSQHQSRQQEFASTLDEQLAAAQQEVQMSSSRSRGRSSGKSGWDKKTIQGIKQELTEAGHSHEFWNQNWTKAQYVEAAQRLLGDCPDA